jgi:hypothetical protein
MLTFFSSSSFFFFFKCLQCWRMAPGVLYTLGKWSIAKPHPSPASFSSSL